MTSTAFQRRLTPLLALAAVLLLAAVAWREVAWVRVREAWLAGERPAGSGPGEGGRPGGASASGGATGAAFTDVTAAAGLDGLVHDRAAAGGWRLPELIGSGGALFDADGDGDLDLLWLPGGEFDPAVDGGAAASGAPTQSARLLANDGRGVFTDVTAGSGAGVPGYAMGVAAADYDGDGDTDVYITRLGPDVLLANDGTGRFTDVTAAAGLGDPAWGSSAAWFDADGDGDLDLYVATYVEWSPALERPCYGVSGARDYCNPLTYPPTPDRLYGNLGDGTFADVSASSGVGAVPRDGLAVLCSDVDADGDVDIYVANDQMPAFLWRNVTGEDAGSAAPAPIRFREEAMLSGAAFNRHGMAIAGMGLAAEDLDDDGDLDLLVTNIVTQSHLGLRNDDGWFEDASGPWGLDRWSVPTTGWGLALFDQDLDGALDLYVANGHVNVVTGDGDGADPFAQADSFARRDAAGRFVAADDAGPALAARGTSRAVLTGDVDEDGDLDLLVTRNGGAPQLLRNEATGAFLVLDLRDRHGGVALNARVEVTATGSATGSAEGTRTWRREVRPHSGYLGSNDPRIHVGLGDAARVGRVIITWPDGGRDELTDLSPGTRWRVRRGAGPGGAPAVQALPGPAR